MIIFLYGPDSYRRREKLKEYIERYKAKYNALSLNNFYLDQEVDWGKLKDFSKSQSLFESSRLGVVSGIGNLEGADQKELINILKENLEYKDLTLIINEGKKPTKDFNFLLKNPVIFWEFENLIGAELQKFLQQEIGKRNLNVDKEGQNLLVQVYAGDVWGLLTELDKLSFLDERIITAAVLERHVNIALPVDIFSLINQIRNSGQIGVRLSLLEELFSRSQDPAMIFNIMAVSPYSDFSWKQRMADYDSAVKSGKLEYQEVILSLVLE